LQRERAESPDECEQCGEYIEEGERLVIVTDADDPDGGHAHAVACSHRCAEKRRAELEAEDAQYTDTDTEED